MTSSTRRTRANSLSSQRYSNSRAKLKEKGLTQTDKIDKIKIGVSFGAKKTASAG